MILFREMPGAFGGRVARRIVTIALLVWLSGVVHATEPGDADTTLANARDAALGGSHVAVPSGFQTLVTNPAGLTGLEPQFTAGGLSFRFSGPAFSLSSVVLQGLSGGSIAALLAPPSVQSLLASIYADVSLSGPLYFGYTGGGMGFGVVNDTSFLIESQGAGSIEAVISERFLLIGGYGMKLPLPESWQSTLALGVGLKGFVRGDVSVATSLLGLPALFDSIGPDLLTDSPFDLVSGIGVDAGLRYVWRDLLGIAVTASNLYSPSAVLSYPTLGGFLDSSADPGAPSYSVLPQNLTVGIAYTPRLGAFERYVQDLTLALDYRDMLDFWIDPADAENIILKFGFGVEARLLEILSIRAGFSDALFAAGLGIDMSVVELNAAMYGSELSLEPGLRPTYNLVVGLEFHQ